MLLTMRFEAIVSIHHSIQRNKGEKRARAKACREIAAEALMPALDTDDASYLRFVHIHRNPLL